VPPWLVVLSGIILIASSLVFILGWINNKWNDNHSFSLACGALYAGMVFGLIILIQSKNNLDIICQIGFILIVSTIIVLRVKSLLKSNTQNF
jgi:hypothetical protein